MKTILKQFTIFIFSCILISTATAQNSNNFEISKNLEIYATLFRELNKNYVDEKEKNYWTHLH